MLDQERGPDEDVGEEIEETVDATGEPGEYRAGFVAVVGRPNVGKSTLINRLVGQKIAITSPKPQTTRVNQLGILTMEDAQIVFVDTPGIHVPSHALGEYMVHEAKQSLEDADVVLCLMDASREPNDADKTVVYAVARAVNRAEGGPPKILGLNKIDLVPEEEREEATAPYRSLSAWDHVLEFSAVTGEGMDTLLELLLSSLPENPPFYPEEDVTQTNMRDIAGELIREQVLHHTREEVPHSVAVVVDDFKEREDGRIYVAAVIYVERDSQKGIIIGRGGAMLKTIGTAARHEIEEMTGAPVYLDLLVKVRKDWRKKEPGLRHMGYGR